MLLYGEKRKTKHQVGSEFRKSFEVQPVPHTLLYSMLGSSCLYQLCMATCAALTLYSVSLWRSWRGVRKNRLRIPSNAWKAWLLTLLTLNQSLLLPLLQPAAKTLLPTSELYCWSRPAMQATLKDVGDFVVHGGRVVPPAPAGIRHMHTDAYLNLSTPT